MSKMQAAREAAAKVPERRKNRGTEEWAALSNKEPRGPSAPVRLRLTPDDVLRSRSNGGFSYGR